MTALARNPWKASAPVLGICLHAECCSASDLHTQLKILESRGWGSIEIIPVIISSSVYPLCSFAGLRYMDTNYFGVTLPYMIMILAECQNHFWACAEIFDPQLIRKKRRINTEQFFLQPVFGRVFFVGMTFLMPEKWYWPAGQKNHWKHSMPNNGSRNQAHKAHSWTAQSTTKHQGCSRAGSVFVAAQLMQLAKQVEWHERLTLCVVSTACFRTLVLSTSVQQKPAGFSLDDGRLVSLHGLLVQDVPERLSLWWLKEIPYQKAEKEADNIQKHTGHLWDAEVAAAFLLAVPSRGEAWSLCVALEHLHQYASSTTAAHSFSSFPLVTQQELQEQSSPVPNKRSKEFFADCLKLSFSFLGIYSNSLFHSVFGFKKRTLIKLLYEGVNDTWGINSISEEWTFALSTIMCWFNGVCAAGFLGWMQNNSSRLKVYGLNESPSHLKV